MSTVTTSNQSMSSNSSLTSNPNETTTILLEPNNYDQKLTSDQINNLHKRCASNYQKHLSTDKPLNLPFLQRVIQAASGLEIFVLPPILDMGTDSNTNTFNPSRVTEAVLLDTNNTVHLKWLAENLLKPLIKNLNELLEVCDDVAERSERLKAYEKTKTSQQQNPQQVKGNSIYNCFVSVQSIVSEVKASQA
jgi:hypothetical protein